MKIDRAFFLRNPTLEKENVNNVSTKLVCTRPTVIYSTTWKEDKQYSPEARNIWLLHHFKILICWGLGGWPSTCYTMITGGLFVENPCRSLEAPWSPCPGRLSKLHETSHGVLAEARCLSSYQPRSLAKRSSLSLCLLQWKFSQFRTSCRISFHLQTQISWAHAS